jgi:hypothetical protein
LGFPRSKDRKAAVFAPAPQFPITRIAKAASSAAFMRNENWQPAASISGFGTFGEEMQKDSLHSLSRLSKHLFVFEPARNESETPVASLNTTRDTTRPERSEI